MTTLAADVIRTYETGYTDDLPVVATDILYQGSALGWSSGTVRPLVAGDAFAGFCLEKADNAAGAASAIRAKVQRQGLIVLAVTGVDGNDDVGKAVYASDDATFTLTASTNSAIGYVYRHQSSTTCIVAFNATGAATIGAAIGGITSLTDNSGGSATDAIAAIGATYDQAEVRNAVASLAAKVNAILAQLG